MQNLQWLIVLTVLSQVSLPFLSSIRALFQDPVFCFNLYECTGISH